MEEEQETPRGNKYTEVVTPSLVTKFKKFENDLSSSIKIRNILKMLISILIKARNVKPTPIFLVKPFRRELF